jgi:oxygen-independent coproporphyrinogen-3 oxidase
MTQPLGVYIHWPFCKSKCPYCDFNSHVRDGIEQARWRKALLTELEYAAREAPGRRVETMFFGGGTPSLMEPATVGALIARTKELWDTAPDVEITLEANPTSVEAGRFAALAEAGVNRVSLGVQALDPAALKFLGREHSVDEALDALEVAK